ISKVGTSRGSTETVFDVTNERVAGSPLPAQEGIHHTLSKRVEKFLLCPVGLGESLGSRIFLPDKCQGRNALLLGVLVLPLGPTDPGLLSHATVEPGDEQNVVVGVIDSGLNRPPPSFGRCCERLHSQWYVLVE